MKVTSIVLLMLVASAKVHPATSGQNILPENMAHLSAEEANESAKKNPAEESEKAKKLYEQDEEQK